MYDCQLRCQEIEADIARYTKKIAHVQDKIIAWNMQVFAKERVAREQLHMAREDEVVYMLDESA